MASKRRDSPSQSRNSGTTDEGDDEILDYKSGFLKKKYDKLWYLDFNFKGDCGGDGKNIGL